jgi:hypothetical protein
VPTATRLRALLDACALHKGSSASPVFEGEWAGAGRRTRRLRASRLQHAGGRHAGRAQVLDVLRTWTDENEQAIKEEKDLAQTLLDDFSRWPSVEAKAAEASGQPATVPDESHGAANAPSPEQHAAALVSGAEWKPAAQVELVRLMCTTKTRERVFGLGDMSECQAAVAI